MRLKANDQLHISSVKADSLLPGEEFEIGEHEGQRLIDRGLATKVAGQRLIDRGLATKVAGSAKNKMAKASANKRRKGK